MATFKKAREVKNALLKELKNHPAVSAGLIHAGNKDWSISVFCRNEKVFASIPKEKDGVKIVSKLIDPINFET